MAALVNAIKWGEYYQVAANDYPTWAARQSAVGRQFDISNWFFSYDSTAGAHSEYMASEAAGQTLLLAWQPSRTSPFKLADILAGAYDAFNTSWADWMLSQPVPVVVRWGHEMNGSFMTWSPLNPANTMTVLGVSSSGAAATTVTLTSPPAVPLASGQQVNLRDVVGPAVNGAWQITVLTPTTFTIPIANSAAYVSGGNVQWSKTTLNAAQYIAAYRYTVDAVRARAAATGRPNNVKWFWCANQADTGTNGGVPLEQFYPGNSYADYVGYDSYNTLNGGYMTPLQTLQGHTNNAQADAYARVTALHPTAPVWVGETGCVDLGDPKDTSNNAAGHSKAQWYTDLFALDLSAIPRLGAAVFFDTNGSRNWVHDSSAAAWAAFTSPSTGFPQGSAAPPPNLGRARVALTAGLWRRRPVIVQAPQPGAVLASAAMRSLSAVSATAAVAGQVSSGFPDASNTGPRIALTTMALGQSGTGWICQNGSYGPALYLTSGTANVVGRLIPFPVQQGAGAAGARLTDCYIGGSGSPTLSGQMVQARASGLTMSYCTVQGYQSPPGNTGYQAGTDNWVEYGYFDSTGNYGGFPTFDHCEFLYLNHPVNATSGTISNCYMHHFANSLDGSQHTDCIFDGGGDTKQMTILHNTLLNDRQDATANAILLSTAFGAQHNVLIDNNLIGGGAYAINPGNTAANPNVNVKITNNRFTTAIYAKCGQLGCFYPAMPTDGVNGCVLSNNLWYDGPNAGKPAS